MSSHEVANLSFPGLVDLAADRIGGLAIAANDEFFAEKENLVKAGRAVFIRDKFTDHGKWMDGWETRRKRQPGHDWCIIRLGTQGVVRCVDVDTSHFLGNSPAYASIDTCSADLHSTSTALTSSENNWTEIISLSSLAAGSHNILTSLNNQPWSHLRLNIFPDGGVSRLRVFGEVVPQWAHFKKDAFVDVALITNGGKTVACSDMFFSSMDNIIMPRRGVDMGDGWETRRRRGGGHDWIIVQLGRTAVIERIEIDTNHFKGNYPDRCSIEACKAERFSGLLWSEQPWRTLLPETPLAGDTQQVFEKELLDVGECSHLKMNIFPDGGVSRLRAWAKVSSMQ